MVFQHHYLDSRGQRADHFSMAKRPRTPPAQQTPKRRPPIFLKQWRKFRGLTQEELAARMGWSVSNVSQLEQGRQGYSQEGLEALAIVLKCTIGQLLSIDPTKDEDMWRLWDEAKPNERKMIVNLAKQVVGSSGSEG